MTSDEVRAAARTADRIFGGAVSRVEQLHQAVGKCAFGPTAPLGLPRRSRLEPSHRPAPGVPDLTPPS